MLLVSYVSTVNGKGDSCIKGVPAPEFQYCIPITENRGQCFYYFDGNDYEVNNSGKFFLTARGGKLSWSQIKTRSILLPTDESFLPISLYIKSNCRTNKNCPK